MKFLALSLLLIASVANAQTVIDGGVIRGQGFDTQNYAPNPFAEKNLLGWTIAGTTQTWTQDTTTGHKLNGISSFKNTVTSGTPNDGSIISGAITFPDNLVGRDCDASVLYHGATAGKWSFVVTDGSGVAASSVVALKNSGTTWAKAIITYPCTTGYKLKAYSTSTLAAGETFNVGNFSWGPPSAGTVAQAQYVGGITVFGASGFTVAGTGAVDYTATAGTTYGASGSLSAPSTLIPAFTYTNMPSGEYFAYVAGPFKTVSGTCVWELIDDSANRWVGELHQTAVGYAGGFLSARFAYTSTANRTIRIRLSYQSVASNCTLDLGFNKMSISLYRFPSQSELAVRPDQTPGTYSGSLVGTSWSVTSGSYVDFAAGSSISLTQTTAQNITCAAAGSSLPGITCTLPRLGNYEVCASGSLQHATTLDTGSIRIVDGGAVVINGGVTQSIGAGYNATFSICGQHAATTLSETFKLQGNTAGGTLSILAGNPITWTIKALDQGMAAPLSQGSVTSNSSGMERVERASLGALSGGCSIGSQSGSWLSSCARLGPGQFSMTINAGIFSATPTCLFSAKGNGTQPGIIVPYVEVASGAYEFHAHNSTTMAANAGLTDPSYTTAVICMGPR